MGGWYRAAVDHAVPPARVILERITAKRMELYRSVPPPGKNIPISVTPANNYNYVPTYEEVEWEVRRLRGHSS